jgi:hypothetical protein
LSFETFSKNFADGSGRTSRKILGVAKNNLTVKRQANKCKIYIK